MNRRHFFATAILGFLAQKLGIKAKPTYGLRSEFNPYNPLVPKLYAQESIPFYTNEILLSDDQVARDILSIRIQDAGEYARECFLKSLL